MALMFLPDMSDESISSRKRLTTLEDAVIAVSLMVKAFKVTIHVPFAIRPNLWVSIALSNFLALAVYEDRIVIRLLFDLILSGVTDCNGGSA